MRSDSHTDRHSYTISPPPIQTPYYSNHSLLIPSKTNSAPTLTKLPAKSTSNLHGSFCTANTKATLNLSHRSSFSPQTKNKFRLNSKLSSSPSPSDNLSFSASLRKFGRLRHQERSISLHHSLLGFIAGGVLIVDEIGLDAQPSSVMHTPLTIRHINRHELLLPSPTDTVCESVIHAFLMADRERVEMRGLPQSNQAEPRSFVPFCEIPNFLQHSIHGRRVSESWWKGMGVAV